MLHTPVLRQPTPAQVAQRSYTVAENPLFPSMPFELRCFGQGVCTVGEGIPSRFATEAAAHGAGERWNVEGRGAADRGFYMRDVAA